MLRDITGATVFVFLTVFVLQHPALTIASDSGDDAGGNSTNATTQPPIATPTPPSPSPSVLTTLIPTPSATVSWHPTPTPSNVVATPTPSPTAGGGGGYLPSPTPSATPTPSSSPVTYGVTPTPLQPTVTPTPSPIPTPSHSPLTTPSSSPTPSSSDQNVPSSSPSSTVTVLPTFMHTPTPPPGGMMVLTFIATLNMTMDTFDSATFKSDVANALAVSVQRILIVDVRAGSVIVRLLVLQTDGTPDPTATTSLQSIFSNATSPLALKYKPLQTGTETIFLANTSPPSVSYPPNVVVVVLTLGMDMETFMRTPFVQSVADVLGLDVTNVHIIFIQNTNTKVIITLYFACTAVPLTSCVSRSNTTLAWGFAAIASNPTHPWSVAYKVISVGVEEQLYKPETPTPTPSLEAYATKVWYSKSGIDAAGVVGIVVGVTVFFTVFTGFLFYVIQKKGAPVDMPAK